MCGHTSRPAVLLALGVLIGGFVSATARADDWPQWLGPQRDGIWRETGIVDKFPADGPKVRWRTPIAGGYAGPAVAGGRVYVMDRILAKGAENPADPFNLKQAIPGQERVLCLNEADGKIVWTHAYDCPYRFSFAYGPRTTPVIADGKVYTLGAEGNLLCLDATDGKVEWSHDFKKDFAAKTPLWGHASHPLVDGSKLICVVGGAGAVVVAFDKDTGKELWRALSAKEPGYCPPMIYEAGGKRQLIVWDSDAVNSLNPDTGEVYWSQPMETYMAMAIAAPRKEGDSLFLTGVMGHSMLLRLNADKPGATVSWHGTPKTSLSAVFSTPFFEDGYLYGNNGGRTGDSLVCVKADTGARVWETMKPNKGANLPSGDSFIVKNGDRFFLFTEQGDLIIAKLSPKGYDEVSRAHLLEPTTPTNAQFKNRHVVWSHPAFANRSIYARNDKEIICVSLAADAQK